MGRFAQSALISIASVGLLLGVNRCPVSDGAPPTTVPASTNTAQTRAEYQQWVDKYAGSWGKAFLTIAAVEGDEKQNAPANEFSPGATIYGSFVSEAGVAEYFYDHENGYTNGRDFSPSTIAPPNFSKLKELLTKLPDDGQQLPPSGRRVIFRFGTTTRVYDRANLTDGAIELIRLSDANIRTWIQEFNPQNEIDARPDDFGGFMRLSADGTQIIFNYRNGVQLWEPITHETLGQFGIHDMHNDSIALSPDGSNAAVGYGSEFTLLDAKTWKPIRKLVTPGPPPTWTSRTEPQFTPDGKYLILYSDDSGLRILDAHTWEAVPHMPDLPEDMIQYNGVSVKKRAVIGLKDGTFVLWDMEKHATVAELKKGGFLTDASFSADGSLLAIVTGEKEELRHLSVWNANTGERMMELRSFEQGAGQINNLMWSPDGQYLLAATSGSYMFNSNEDIDIWNLKSGRHRAEFTGCTAGVIGMALLKDGNTLVAGCADGRIRFWDYADAMKRIGAFEDSIAPH